MKTDYCAYPPQIAPDVEISEQREGDRKAFIAGSASAGRYLLIRDAEYRVLQMLGEGCAPTEICRQFKQRYGGTLAPATLTKFLSRLDDYGILAGDRAAGRHLPGQQLSTQFYLRFSLFNPDQLFTRVVGVLRWAWTVQFFAGSLLLMLIAAALALINGTEVAQYGGYILREHYLAVIFAGLLVGITHEFAHGLTCKAFGGRATEVGGLLIYYCLPALYCNVSGLHLIPQRGRRLWVIAAGVYWQLLVGTFALLAWLMLAPFTIFSDLAFIFLCGSVLNVAFNGNPLIKLDGYYFLSQWLGMPNLMDRARAWWRDLLRSIFFGAPSGDEKRYRRREHAILAAFGLLSFAYTLGLRVFIVILVGSYLTDLLHLPGLLLTAVLALTYMRRPFEELMTAAISALRQLGTNFNQFWKAKMSIQNQSATIDPGQNDTRARRLRRRLIPLAIASLLTLIFCLPWNASVGANGVIIAIPGKEAIIHAPEGAILSELRVRPGDLTEKGAVLGRMSNAELDEQLAQVQIELDRANAEYERFIGDLRLHEEAITRSEVNLRQRQRDYAESDSERRQIEERRRAESGRAKYLVASAGSFSLPADDNRPEPGASTYPAAIAVLQSDAEMRHARLAEASLQLDRTRALYAQGIAPRSELDGAETRASTLRIELTAARQRLDAALVEHRQRHLGLTTELLHARSQVSTDRLQTGNLHNQLRAASSLISTLTTRRDLLRGRMAHLSLVTPRAGAIFGEELPRMVGQYFPKGSEICRVADTQQLLARIQVPEREIGDVRPGNPVRLKVRAHPGRVFRGSVAKIGSEGELDPSGQVIYRVELIIENTDDLLRPGMTAFARVDFDRRMIGGILLHKLKQALRPELWML
jgi:putative peptide zinc metalloprotease protein